MVSQAQPITGGTGLNDAGQERERAAGSESEGGEGGEGREGGGDAGGGAVRRRARGFGGLPLGEVARQAASEATATCLLLLLTCLPATPAAPLLLRATTAGLVVALLVQCFDHISGAMMNPTVTLAAAVAGRLAAPLAAALVAAQAAGAAGAAAALALLAPAGSPAACVTRPAPDMPVFQALCLEAVLGGCLVLANCAAWDSRNRRLLDSWPLRIGSTVTALSLVGGDLTGASMNPLRSLGPALCAGDWTHHWLYWLGPLAGGALAAAGYRVLWAASARASPRGASPPPTRRTSPHPAKLYTPA